MKLGKFVGLALMALTLGLAGQSLAAEPIKIGVYLPLTGQNAFGGPARAGRCAAGSEGHA